MSRARSARGASAGGPAAGRPGVFVQAPQPDIYVALLGVALGAMILGCILLLMILMRYDFKTKVSALTPPARTVLVAAAETAPTIVPGVCHA